MATAFEKATSALADAEGGHGGDMPDDPDAWLRAIAFVGYAILRELHDIRCAVTRR